LPVNIQDRSDNQIHIKLQVAAEVESVRVSANDITMPVASQNMDSVELDRRWIENLPSKEADPLAVPSLFLSPAAGTMSPTCWRPRAGYNSLCEVVPLKKKALVVPRLGPRAEQRMRAELFQQKGLIDVLDPQEVSPRNLAQRIVDDLERTDLPIANAAIDMSGARNAACHLSGLVLERASLQPMTVSASQTVGGLSAKRAASG
jgi:hypothetical protein